ncbi:hypothetical protein CEXT_540921 [Caerostris extrusa]|uniref:Uncharacterized protein n=1 Tax=Caerostris extrusa TaxID=172846 RepID=A0AAV4NAM2_CAEEX|nr:hypothetical protein CEXT_540921 [Caerostris extrusa]
MMAGLQSKREIDVSPDAEQDYGGNNVGDGLLVLSRGKQMGGGRHKREEREDDRWRTNAWCSERVKSPEPRVKR